MIDVLGEGGGKHNDAIYVTQTNLSVKTRNYNVQNSLERRGSVSESERHHIVFKQAIQIYQYRFFLVSICNWQLPVPEPNSAFRQLLVQGTHTFLQLYLNAGNGAISYGTAFLLD